jgi:enterochelin esterase-like enzyme
MPTGPFTRFAVQRTVASAGHTKIGVALYHGPASGVTGRVWVWAPPQYFQPRNADRGFPVLIALPGGPGHPDNYWFGADLRLQENLDRWTREGKSPPYIVVMPMLNPDRRYHDCSDIPGSPKMDTWLTTDVPALVRANFRTLRDRRGWGLMGSSSGGFCALKSVLKYPERFAAAIPSGPDLAPDSPLWHADHAAMALDDPSRLASKLLARGGPQVCLGFQDGSTELRDLRKVRAFVARYGRGPIRTRVQIIPAGGHNAAGYTRGMDMGTIAWFSHCMIGPTR